ncbi:endonuclease/exonuclease/phosphatase family protein [Tamlana fucoidanivorans]|uniref:Endonuclease/exonuclease/phosphatase family protein n=1 Tax=Allotamlana fucoidanivorans TaxID=2583814 RepID=A0A5C4SUA1_9FLAO|nr:endonuclease/exonuclease/phosphatase family protein [Tamlana fucoidanivorans]TNJ47191.1 endonuclease/exonuclease/phosphatase family protein [Tamlana fucoidanivorans]
MMNFLRAFVFCVNLLIILALLLLHFFVKDATYQSSLWFYTFPLPLIIMVVLGMSIVLGKKMKYNIWIASVLFLIWVGRSFSFNFSKTSKPDDVKIVFWNASRDNDYKKALDINKEIPDLLVLTEAVHSDVQDVIPDHPFFHFYKSKGELKILSKTPILVKLDTVSDFNTNVVHFQTAHTNFYAIDAQGSTDVPRSWEWRFVNSIIKVEENTVILGDFNIPYESIFLKKLKSNYVHFFYGNGIGFRETWFWGIPLLSLDQIWVSKDIEIVCSTKRNTWVSDHSMIKTVVRKP